MNKKPFYYYFYETYVFSSLCQPHLTTNGTLVLLRFSCITTQSMRSATLPRTQGTTEPLAMSGERRATTGLWPSKLHNL